MEPIHIDTAAYSHLIFSSFYFSPLNMHATLFKSNGTISGAGLAFDLDYEL
jgi:hypothetical protein